MTEAKEAEQTYEDKPESISKDTAAINETEMLEENPKEDKIEVGEKEVEGEAVDVDDEVDHEKNEESEEEDDEQEEELQPCLVVASNDGRTESLLEGSCEKRSNANIDSSVDAVEDVKDLQTVNILSTMDDCDLGVPVDSLKNDLTSAQKSPVNEDKESIRPDSEEDNGVKLDVCGSLSRQSADDETISKTCGEASPNAQSSPPKVENAKEEVNDDVMAEEGPMDVESRNRSDLLMFDTDTSGAGDSGTEEEQAAFMMELHKFHKERSLDFKPPNFYRVPLNLLKLWRAVLKLGGYDKVTACKDWRQVGESFNPPKTCTTISWTFRVFYEKALLEYERYRASIDSYVLPTSVSVPTGAENQAPGSGRARRDAAARAMQGWHSQRILDNGEVSDPIIKEKNTASLSKKEKGGNPKRKIISSDDDFKPAHMALPKEHSDFTVIDIGTPADWVKINVRATRDCFEVYALVPGLLREEVRVQSDPAGRLVISGEPENADNPWNVTPFKKVVSLPSRIDPHQTSAVVTLHGQLFVRVPFEQCD
ncbi:hypothetical protein RND81_11G118600 [Saponaria officinalis]|uniref:Uncharacterized protein n=1 Tax=Saponaria officinalis TaxID=3572 RepID=A0AAW1HKS5_SAPOF